MNGHMSLNGVHLLATTVSAVEVCLRATEITERSGGILGGSSSPVTSPAQRTLSQLSARVPGFDHSVVTAMRNPVDSDLRVCPAGSLFSVSDFS